MRFLSRVIPAAVSALVLAAGCASNPPAPTRTNDKPQMTAQQPKPADDGKAKLDNQVAAGAADLDAALRELAGVSLFFDFDQATLTAEAQSKLSKVADVLVKYPALTIQVQGNTDDRGTEAYNLALGQRRADAAKDYLARLGVKGAQVSTLSFGEEKPKDTAHDEAAYQQNRRDDVVAK